MVDVPLLYGGACLVSTGVLHWQHHVCTNVRLHLHGACAYVKSSRLTLTFEVQLKNTSF